MVLRDELHILQKSAQKSLDMGWEPEPEAKPTQVDLIFDPPAVVIHFESPYLHDIPDLYLDPLFPLYDREWAIRFWGTQMMPSQTYIVLPAWQYHQHRLLEFLQQRDKEAFYTYLAYFL